MSVLVTKEAHCYRSFHYANTIGGQANRLAAKSSPHPRTVYPTRYERFTGGSGQSIVLLQSTR